MKFRIWHFAALLVAQVLALGFTAPARADLQVCNDSGALVGVAIGYRENGSWITEGWWRIPASVCTSVIEGNLEARYFYLHAEEADTGGRWRGPVFMCSSNKQFKISGVKDCFARGYERTGFFEIDTGDQKTWQVRLTEADREESKDQ